MAVHDHDLTVRRGARPAPFRLGLSGSFTILVLLAALMALGNIALVGRALARLDGVAETVNIAGKLRMLSQKLALEATRHALLPQHPEPLEQTLSDYELALTTLEQGGSAFGLYVHRIAGDHAGQLGLLREQWTTYRWQIETLLDGEISGAEAVTTLGTQAAQLLAAADGLVFALTYASDRTQHRVFRALSGLLVTQLLLLGWLALAVRRKVVQPLQRLSDGARALADGTYDRPIAPLPANELGEVGFAMNEAAHRIGDLISRLEQLASCDPLTGLPNRTALQHQVRQTGQLVNRRAREVAVLLIDLDNFKLVNDTFGHTAGDALLQVVAIRLGRCIRAGDLLARMGGDEFVVLMPDINGRDEVEATAARLLAAFDAPIPISGHAFPIGLSIGIALYPEHGDIDALIDIADQAMYRAKRNGRNGYRFHDGHPVGAGPA